MAPAEVDPAGEEAFMLGDDAESNGDASDHGGHAFPHGLYAPRSLVQRFYDILRGMKGLRHRRRWNARSEANETKSKSETFSALLAQRQYSAVVLAILKRFAILCPVLILMLFGLLHLLQVTLGGARIFWDTDREDFLPNWGKPGHAGDGLAKYPTDATRDVIPVACHSHNDYWRRIPLFEAIHYGCTGVEADVWLFDNELYVGHDTGALTRERTFRSLYVDPLVDLLDKQNPSTEFGTTQGHGVFDTSPEQTLVLLVDFKTDGAELWPHVESQLSALRDKGYLTYFNGTTTVAGAVTVVGTGNTPFDLIVANSTYRDIFFDAPLAKLWDKSGASAMAASTDEVGDVVETRAEGQGETGLSGASLEDFNPSTSYYASVSFNSAVGTVWGGHLSKQQMRIIRGQIRAARRRGLKARYWDTPAWPISLRNHVWHVLMKEGADMLNVDDLKSASRLDWRKWRHEWW